MNWPEAIATSCSALAVALLGSVWIIAGAAAKSKDDSGASEE